MTTPSGRKQTSNGNSDETAALIQDAVNTRLNDLATYKLVEEMVEKRVATAERNYRILAGVVIGAAVFIMAAFFKVTADNASEQVAKTLADTALTDKLKEIETAHVEAKATRAQLSIAAQDALASGVKILGKLQELEKQDNVLRYSHNGNVYFDLTDGELRLRRKDNHKEVIITVNPRGELELFNGDSQVNLMTATSTHFRQAAEE